MSPKEFDPNMKELATEFLYRLTYPDKFHFDGKGYLLPHREENLLRRVTFKGKVPMITEPDVILTPPGRWISLTPREFCL